VRWYPNVVVAEIQGYRPLHLDLRVPAGAGPFPVVVWIHGGAWWSGSRLRLPEPIAAVGFHDRLLRRGYAVADADYRLSREATFPAQLYDVKAAIRWLRAYTDELHLDPARFAAWGESAGGHLAALAGLTGGTDDGVQAVVDWYGAAGMLGGLRAPLPDDAPAVWLLGGQPSEHPALAAEASPLRRVHPAAPPSCACTAPPTRSCRTGTARRSPRRCAPRAYVVTCTRWPEPSTSSAARPTSANSSRRRSTSSTTCSAADSHPGNCLFWICQAVKPLSMVNVAPVANPLSSLAR
jgi:acetyl esterase/lipase